MVASALAGNPSYAPVVAALEAGSMNERHCPHCGSEASVGRGMANGLRRFRCKACRKSFNALTGTPLAGLRKKDRWLSFGRSLSEGEIVVESAKRCGVAISTAFR
jgi:transposase-like protein